MGAARGIVTGELGCENSGGEAMRGEGVDGETEPRTEARERREAQSQESWIWREWVRATEGRLVWGEVGEAGHEGRGGYRGSFVTGGLDCEGGGGGEDMVEVGNGNRRISEGEQWVYRVGRECNSQKACM